MYLLILDVRILNATVYFCCLGPIFCSISPLKPSTKASFLTTSLSFAVSTFYVRNSYKF